ncbi:hypothetical protein DVH24_003807 [Malus domestica]|uniref:Uncharacterized protein n=1 Tax=Malus domestica TaxID=3750 RepID=A0A498KBG0_MALDO|nr:hypothetical protein DVH24_003807 [Malus domestica]
MQVERKPIKEAYEKEMEKYIDEATLEEMKMSNNKADLINAQDELEQKLKVKVESKQDLHELEFEAFCVAHRKPIKEEYTEGYNLEYLLGYTRRDHLGGYDIHKIYEEIKNTNFLMLEDLLNEILDLEAKREGKCSSSDDPVSNVPTDPSTSAREKGVGKRD